MSYNFRPYSQDQLLLLPPALQDWLGEDSLARFVSDVIDLLNDKGRLRPLYDKYRSDGWGRAAYHPCMMVKVLMYAYCSGIRSSRKIAMALEHDVALRYLSGNQQPDHRTIADFRKDHIKELAALFPEVLELCREAGLVKLGRVALDGRRVAGNPALERNRTRSALKREIADILAEAEQVDAAEDEQYGLDQRGDELPKELRTRADRMRRLKQGLERLTEQAEKAHSEQAERIRTREEEEQRTGRKKRGRKPKPPEAVVDTDQKANTTDPDSRVMKTRKGWVQGYNGQAAVDCESQVIVAQAVTQEEVDYRQLEPMLACCAAQAGQRPVQCLADAGYWSEANAGLQNEETELFIATTKDWKQRKALREESPPKGRIPRDLPPRERMERKLRTKRGQAIYKQRAATVEPVFGQMEGRGLNRFMMRGRAKAAGEWALWCITHDLLKLWRSAWRPSRRLGFAGV